MNIQLCQWTQENQADLIRISNAADRRYLSGRLPNPYTEISAGWWYENVVSGDGKTGIFRAVVMDGTVVGNVTIECKEDISCRDCEIGYLLDPKYQSRGIMTEAVEQICSIAFRELDIARITGTVFAENLASQKVLLKNGFVLEGVLKRAVYKNGKLDDLHIYGKYREGHQEESVL